MGFPLTALEIDISNVPRDISEKDLQEILIEGVSSKRIIEKKVFPATTKERDWDLVRVLGIVVLVTTAVLFTIHYFWRPRRIYYK